MQDRTGRTNARWLLLCAAVAWMSAAAGAAPRGEPRVDVTEADGVYTVSATFAVAESLHDVVAVLTDYDRIPKFMPDVQVSKVLERSEW